MKISVITVTYNSAATLARTIESILSQTYDDIEYVVKDGGSTDATVDIIKRYEPLFHGRMRWVSARDGGIYEAMNEGILMATGDVVGILNSDDYFTSDDVLETVASHMRDTALDAVYGDIHFVRPGNPNKVARYYSSSLSVVSGFALALCRPIRPFMPVSECTTITGSTAPTSGLALTSR